MKTWISENIDIIQKVAKAISLLVLLATGYLLYAFVKSNITVEQLKAFIEQGGTIGKLIYFSYLSLAVVLSPLISITLWPVALLAYGFWQAVLITFLGSVTGGMFAFFLARKFGRVYVKRLVGKEALEKIDDFGDSVSWRAFFILRFLSSNYFDYVSYAAGLTKMNTLVYFLITASTSFIWTFLVFFLLQKTILLGSFFFLAILLSVFAITFYATYRVWKIYSTK